MTRTRGLRIVGGISVLTLLCMTLGGCSDGPEATITEFQKYDSDEPAPPPVAPSYESEIAGARADHFQEHEECARRPAEVRAQCEKESDERFEAAQAEAASKRGVGT